MPPQIPNQTMSESSQKCPWYQPLCKVTPISKYLAMIIFIMLPFVGGSVGYKIASEKITEISKSAAVEDSTLEVKSDFDKSIQLEAQVDKNLDLNESNDNRTQDSVGLSNTQAIYEDYKLSADLLFQKYFISQGAFTVNSIKPVVMSGMSGGGGALEFLPSPQIFLTGEARVTFSEYFGAWLLEFMPDSDSKTKIPQLKTGENIWFAYVSPDKLCLKINCDTAVGTYNLKLKVFNPTLYYEVIPSDTGAFKFNLRSEKFEVIQ